MMQLISDGGRRGSHTHPHLDRLPDSAFQSGMHLERVGDDAGEEGSTTVEYAIGAVATAGFAGLLVAVLKSGGVKGLLTGIIQSALSI